MSQSQLSTVKDIITLDLTNLNCPLPVLKTKKFLAQVPDGTQVKVLTTDKASIADLQDFCQKTGHHLINQEQHDGIIYTVIQHR